MKNMIEKKIKNFKMNKINKIILIIQQQINL